MFSVPLSSWCRGLLHHGTHAAILLLHKCTGFTFFSRCPRGWNKLNEKSNWRMKVHPWFLRSFFSLEVVSSLCHLPKLSHWIFISAAKFKTGSNKTQGEEEKDVDKGSISLFLQPTPPVCGGGSAGGRPPVSWPCLERCRGCWWPLQQWCSHAGAT